MLKDCRVLAVDENRDVADLYVLFLTGHHAELRIASSGQEALAQVGPAWTPDVLLVHWRLPDMPAARLAAAVCELAGRRVGLVCTTGDARPDSREAARAEGFDECLVRPVGLDALLSAVASAARVARREAR